MAATTDSFFGKKDDLRVPYGRGKKPDSEKSVDLRPEERLMSKSPLAEENKLKAVKLCTGDGMKNLENPAPLETLAMDPENKSIISGVFVNSKENKDKDRASVPVYTSWEVCWDLRVPYGRGKKPDSEKSVDLRPEERLTSKSPLAEENKLKAVKLCTGDGTKNLENPAPLETLAMDPENKSIISGVFVNSKENKDKDRASVKVYTRWVRQEVFWDTKLQRHRTWEELEKDPELYQWIVASSDNLRINADNCWDSMELEHPATFEELGMDPENKGIISDFFGFVRANELCKRIGKASRKDNCLVYESPGTGRSSIISAMANYLKSDIYHLNVANFSSLRELQYALLSTRNRSIIAIEGLYQCAGMLLHRKSDEYAAKYLMMGIDALFWKRNNERIFVFTTNHRDQHDVASLRPVGMDDIYINTSSPLPTSLPDGGKWTYHNSLLVSNSEKENMREACDSTKGYLLPNFDATENKAVKVYSRRGRDWSNSTELERPLTFSELGKDPENEGIISDLLSFVRDKELYERIGKNWRRGYWLYDSPGTDRSSLIAAMASYLKFDIYDLDLTGLSSIRELMFVLTSINKRSLIAIKDIDHWFGMHPNLKKEVMSLRRENKLTLSGLFEIIEGLLKLCLDQQIIVVTTNHNHRDRYHTALLSPLNIDAYVHTSSPQSIALPDGGEIVEYDSSEQKPLVDFDATNYRAYQSSVLVSNLEKENTRETDRYHTALLSPLNIDAYMHASSPHPIALPDGGETVELDLSEQKPLVDFDATNDRAYQSSVLVSNLEKENMTQTSKRRCMAKSAISSVHSTTSISSTVLDDTDNIVHLGRAYQSGPTMFNSKKKDMRERLSGECLTKSVFSSDDSKKQNSLPDHKSLAIVLENTILDFNDEDTGDSEDFDHCTAMLPNVKDEFVDGLSSSCGNECIILSTTNHRDRRDVALLPLVNMDTYIHTASPQPIALPDGGENVLLQSIQQKSLVDFDATNNRDQSSVIVSNSKKKYTRVVSEKRCRTQSLLSLVESTTRISSTDFDSPENREHLNSPIVFNSEKKDTREALKGECLNKNALSLHDSTKQNSCPDFDATINKAHLIEAYQNGPVMSLSDKNRGDASKRECIGKSILGLEDLRQHFGGRRDDAAKGFGDSLAWTSFEVLETLAPWEQPNDCAPLLSLGRSTLGGCVQQEKSPDLPRVMRIDTVGQKVTKLPRYLDGLTAQSASSSRCPIGLPDGGHIVLLDALEQSTQNIVHLARAQQCSSTVSLPEKKMVRTLKRKYKTISVIVENHQQHQSIALPDGGEIMELDSSVKKPLMDCDATTNMGFQSGVLVSYSKRQCMTLSGISGFYRTYSLAQKSFEVQETLLPLKQLRNSAHTDRVRQIWTLMHEEPSNPCGSFPIHMDTLIGRFRRYLCPSLSYSVCIHSIFWEQPNDFVPLLSPRRLTFKGCVQLEKSSYLPGLLQIEAVERGLTKSPRHSGGSTGQSASSSHWPIGLRDGGSVVLLDPLEQSTKNVVHAVKADLCFPAVSLPKNKMVRKSLKTKCPTMSLVFEGNRHHFGRRCEGPAKSLGVTPICMKHGINRVSSVNRIHKPHGIHWLPFRQCGKAGESGPTVCNSEKGSMREALKRDSLRDLRQHIGARRKGAAKGLWDSLALKSFEVLDNLSLGKHSNNIRCLAWRRTLIHKHCVRLKKSQDLPRSLLSDCSGKLAAQSAIGLPDGGHIPSLSKTIVKNTLKRKSRTMSVLSLEDHRQHIGSRWGDDANFLSVKHICRQLAVDGESTAKCIYRQHGTSRWPFKQSAIGLPDGGYMLSLSKKKIVRKTFKRKCRNMSVLSLEYHWKVDSKWEDSVKSIGAKHIYRQLVIHFVYKVKRIRRHHGFHRWPFQQDWATRKGYSLGDERPIEFTSLSADGKLVSRLQRIHLSWLGRFLPWPSALTGGGEIVGPTALSSSEFAATNRAHRVGQDQSGSTASHSKKKRTREQEDLEEINTSLTLNDLRQHYGRKRKDAAESLGVSVSTLKRICRQHGIKRWPNIKRKKVWRPPDPHGETNPSPTCETLLTNGQIEMENDPTPTQAMLTIPQTMGSSNDWRNMPTSQDEPFLEEHGLGSLDRRVTSCYNLALSQPMTTIPHTMGSLDDSRNLLASQEEPFVVEDFSRFIDASCYNPALSQPMPTIPHMMGSSIDCRNLVTSQQEPFLEGDVFRSINWTFPTDSYPALSQPMTTIPHTMPTIPLAMPLKVKAIYRDAIIKFQLPLTAGVNELKEEVSKTLKIEHGSFDVEFEDEDGDWILMACDDNVREYLQLVTSLGNQGIKLKIRNKV